MYLTSFKEALLYSIHSFRLFL